MLFFQRQPMSEVEVDEHLVRLPKLKEAFTKFNGSKAQLDAITQAHGENIGSVRDLGGEV